MGTTSAVGGASSAWSDYGASRASAMKEKMFAKTDGDGSGSVDAAELQTMLDQMGQRGGAAAGASSSTSSASASSGGSASELLSKMDSDGSGSLSAEELDAGMQQMGPPPTSSTVDFAQQRDASGGQGGGPGGAGRPPPPPADSADSSSSSTSSTTLDPLDTNEDGTVSAEERLAGDMDAAIQSLLQTADTDGDNSISESEADVLSSSLSSALSSLASAGPPGGAQGGGAAGGGGGGGGDRGGERGGEPGGQANALGSNQSDSERLNQLVAMVSRQYQQAAANAADGGMGSTLDVAA